MPKLSRLVSLQIQGNKENYKDVRISYIWFGYPTKGRTVAVIANLQSRFSSGSLGSLKNFYFSTASC